jgi:small subunit ribosomal protein S3
MEEKKFVQFKKDELEMREFVKNSLGKGRISNVTVEYTPVGEKIIVATNKPGIVIGTKGERIEELTAVLKKKFGLENPHVEILEITKPEFDAQLTADDIALALERLGSIKFKIVAYKMLQRIMDAGALGVEIVLAGKLPSERAKTWRFSQGYLKKIGESSSIVNRAEARADTMMGTIGIKVSILPPDAKIEDQIDVTDKVINDIKLNKLKAGEQNDNKAKRNKKHE